MIEPRRTVVARFWHSRGVAANAHGRGQHAHETHATIAAGAALPAKTLRGE